MNPEQTDNTTDLENLAGLLAYNPDKFVHKTLLESKAQKIILFSFAAGQELKTHTTPLPALLIVLEGTCLFKINNKIQTLAAGEVFSIPAQIPHALSAQTNFKMILVKQL